MKENDAIVGRPYLAVSDPKLDKPLVVECMWKGRHPIWRYAKPSCRSHTVDVGDKNVVGAEENSGCQTANTVIPEWDFSQGTMFVGDVGTMRQ